MNTIPNGSFVSQEYLDEDNMPYDMGIMVERNVSQTFIPVGITNSTINLTINNSFWKDNFLVEIFFVNESGITVIPGAQSDDCINITNFSVESDHEDNETSYRWTFDEGLDIQEFSIWVNYTVNNTLSDKTYKPDVELLFKGGITYHELPAVMGYGTTIDYMGDSATFNSSNEIQWKQTYGRQFWITLLGTAEQPIIEKIPPYMKGYQNYTISVLEIDVTGSKIWLLVDKDGTDLLSAVFRNLSTYEYRNATSDLIINGTVNYIKFLNNNKSWIVLVDDIWQFSDVDGSVLVNGTYNTFFGGEQYHDSNVLPSGTDILDINEFTGDVFSFDIGEVENDFIMVEGDGALRFDQTLNIFGNLVDMGAGSINNVITAPTTGYVNGSISPVVGNTYCVNISGKYAKFEVISITANNILINWAYQPDGSNYFIPPVITIISPVNMTYNVGNVNLNYTVSEPT
ncbi:MAG: hypothetical protein M8353_12215, partial [ANME-2 cluster archaeon]|nr:hypothetical protein [ANME-2 cluster archaeon]